MSAQKDGNGKNLSMRRYKILMVNYFFQVGANTPWTEITRKPEGFHMPMAYGYEASIMGYSKTQKLVADFAKTGLILR